MTEQVNSANEAKLRYNIGDLLWKEANGNRVTFIEKMKLLAQAVGVHNSAVSKWTQISEDREWNELKNYPDSISDINLQKIANHFNCKVKDLYNE